MHSLITNTLPSLLNLSFKISCHKILLYNYTFTLHDCATLIRLLSHSVNPFVLILINSIVSGFSCTLIIVFGLILTDNVYINGLINLLLPSNILTLVSGIDTASCVCFSGFFVCSMVATCSVYNGTTAARVLISFLVLDESSKVLHLLSVYVRAQDVLRWLWFILHLILLLQFSNFLLTVCLRSCVIISSTFLQVVALTTLTFTHGSLSFLSINLLFIILRCLRRQTKLFV